MADSDTLDDGDLDLRLDPDSSGHGGDGRESGRPVAYAARPTESHWPSPTRGGSFQQKTWDRHRVHFNDRYLELFRSTFDGDPDPPDPDLAASQIGAVRWEAEEKGKLFAALARKGRHSLDLLSDLVGSKSEVEIKAYVDWLRRAETEHQVFAHNVENISPADIPAAVEIGPECEELLDHAADALAAFQEQYDYFAGTRHDQSWLIDCDAAEELDARSEALEGAGSADGADLVAGQDSPPQETTRFFHLSTFLTLSELFFMNSGHEGATTWHQLAQDGQQPAMALDAVAALHDLVVSFSRRLIQSCLFMTQSRIRSASTEHYTPAKHVRRADVRATLNVLNVDQTSQRFWTRLARRNRLTVIDHAKRRGVRKRVHLPYDHLETILSIPRRRRSSSSSSSNASGMVGSTSSATSGDKLDRVSDGAPLSHGDGDEDMPSSPDARSDDGVEEGDVEDDASDRSREEQSDRGEDQDDPPKSVQARQNVPGTTHAEQMQRHLDQEETFLEEMDQKARRREEARLLRLLREGGQEDGQWKENDDVVEDGGEEGEDEDDDAQAMARRPPPSRKSVSDTMGWSGLYAAEWERAEGVTPAAAFAATELGVKRRRLLHATPSDQP